MTLVPFGPAHVDPALLGSIYLEHKRNVTPAPGQTRTENPYGYGDMWVAVAALNLRAATPRYDSYGYTDVRNAIEAAATLLADAQTHGRVTDIEVLGTGADTAWVRRSLVSGVTPGNARNTARVWMNYHASSPHVIVPVGEQSGPSDLGHLSTLLSE